MAKDVNIHVKAPGADKAKRDLDKIADSSRKVGGTVKQSARQGAQDIDQLSQTTDKAQGRFGSFASKIKSWATGLVGITAIIAGITSAIRAQIRAMEEHAQIAADQQRSLLSLQYLGEFFKERPQLRKEVAGLAEYGARPFGEVAGAWYNLRSKAARLTSGQRQSILQEALELGRTQPEAPLDTIVDMLSLYTKLTGATDINQVQNVIQQTITEAGGGAADVAKYMPMFLPVGMAGGLTGPQAAGLWSYVTTQMAEPSMATTGLRSVFMALQGRGTPESQKMLQQMGITPGADFFQKIGALSIQQRAGRFGLGQAELLAGREGAPVLLSMLQDPRAMMETVAKVTGMARGDIDITQSMIGGLMGADEIARAEERRRRLGIEIENIKGRDARALKWDVFIKTYEKQMRERGVTEYVINEQVAVERIKAGLGLEPGGAFWSFMTSPTEWTPIPRNPLPPVIINDSSVNYFPVAGTAADREIGPISGSDLKH